MKLTDQEARKELSETQKMAKRVNHLLAGFVLVILCIPFFTMCTSAHAEFVLNTDYENIIVACSVQKDAEDVMEARIGFGVAESTKIFNERDSCAASIGRFRMDEVVGVYKNATTVKNLVKGVIYGAYSAPGVYHEFEKPNVVWFIVSDTVVKVATKGKLSV